MLIDKIREHASESAAAGDFEAVAKTLSDKTVVVRVGKVGGKETLSAIVNGGHDANAVIAAMRSVPMSSELLDTLTVSGVDWDDDLTKYVMGGLVAAGEIDAAVVTITQGLSTRMDAPAGRTVTADECREAWNAAELARDWSTVQNENINAAVFNRTELIAALRKSADKLEGAS